MPWLQLPRDLQVLYIWAGRSKHGIRPRPHLLYGHAASLLMHRISYSAPSPPQKKKRETAWHTTEQPLSKYMIGEETTWKSRARYNYRLISAIAVVITRVLLVRTPVITTPGLPSTRPLQSKSRGLESPGQLVYVEMSALRGRIADVICHVSVLA